MIMSRQARSFVSSTSKLIIVKICLLSETSQNANMCRAEVVQLIKAVNQVTGVMAIIRNKNKCSEGCVG